MRILVAALLKMERKKETGKTSAERESAGFGDVRSPGSAFVGRRKMSYCSSPSKLNIQELV